MMNKLYFFNNLILILIIFVIYLMYDNLKKTEEKFENIIQVHFQETSSTQHLYKVDLLNQSGISVSKEHSIENLINIIALFPKDNNTVYLLDSKQQIFKATIDGFNNTNEKINDFNSGTEYPVKIVSRIVNEILESSFESKTCVLTSKGDVYGMDGTTIQAITGKNIIDFTFVIDNINIVVFYIDNKGDVYRNDDINKISAEKKFIQIIGSGVATSSTAMNKPIYVLSKENEVYYYNYTDNNFIKINFDSSKPSNIKKLIPSTTNSTTSFGMICGNGDFYFDRNYRTGNNTYNAVNNQISNLVQHAVSVDNGSSEILYNQRIENSLYDEDGTEIIINDVHDNNLLIYLFTGTSASNMFVIHSGDSATTKCPPRLTQADCFLCMEDNYNDCQEIYNCILDLINGGPAPSAGPAPSSGPTLPSGGPAPPSAGPAPSRNGNYKMKYSGSNYIKLKETGGGVETTEKSSATCFTFNFNIQDKNVKINSSNNYLTLGLNTTTNTNSTLSFVEFDNSTLILATTYDGNNIFELESCS